MPLINNYGQGTSFKQCQVMKRYKCEPAEMQVFKRLDLVRLKKRTPFLCSLYLRSTV